RQNVVVTRRNGHHVAQAGRDVGLAVGVVSPPDHRGVGLERQTVGSARCDRHYVAQAKRNGGLAKFVPARHPCRAGDMSVLKPASSGAISGGGTGALVELPVANQAGLGARQTVPHVSLDISLAAGHIPDLHFIQESAIKADLRLCKGLFVVSQADRLRTGLLAWSASP